MNYSLTITLSEEQNDALLAAVSEINTNGGTTTAESLLQENGTNFVNERVKHYYNASINRLGNAASGLDYAARKALIAQVESQLPTP